MLECKVTEIIEPKTLSGEPTENVFVVFGEVVGIHIDEAIVEMGGFDMALARPIGTHGLHGLLRRRRGLRNVQAEGLTSAQGSNKA